jgi:YD repeat-containing protein
LTGVLAPGGVTLTLGYDAAGRLASVSDPLGASVLYTYDANGDLASVQRPDAGVEQYGYDHHRLRQVVDAAGQTLFQNSFDAWQRVVQQSDALSKTPSSTAHPAPAPRP